MRKDRLKRVRDVIASEGVVMEMTRRPSYKNGCGSVCCVLGWAGALSRRGRRREFRDGDTDTFGLYSKGQAWLGLTEAEARCMGLGSLDVGTLIDLKITRREVLTMIDRATRTGEIRWPRRVMQAIADEEPWALAQLVGEAEATRLANS